MDLGNKMFGAMAWSGIERILLQTIQFGLGIILARILTPAEYGTMAILMVFIILSEVFIDSGFSKALTQKINRTESDKSTVFIFNIGIGLFCYLLIWLSAPGLARFYELEELTILFRVIGLSLIVNGIYAVPITLFTIDLDYKSITKINLISVIISGVIAVFFAKNGYGVWSLVYQVLIRSALACIATWVLVKWKPSFIFSKQSFKELFSYGSKLLASSLLANLFSNLNALLIGKYIGAKDLGFYSRGTQFSDVVYNVFSPAINGVLLPGLAPLQDEKDKLVKHSRTIIKTTSLITLPFFLSLTVLAEPIILLLLTEKWASAIPIMQFFCIARLITVIGGININLLYIIGRTDLVLKQQYLCIAVRVALVLFALPYGIVYIALAEFASSTIHFFINAYFPGKLLGYGPWSQIKDNLKIILSGLLMVLPLCGSYYFFDNNIVQICLALIFGVLFYLGGIYLFKVSELTFFLNKIKVFLK